MRGPRLIRKGEAEGEPEPAAEAHAAPATPTDAAQVVAEKMAQLTPDQAVAFFGEVFARLPPEVQAKLAAASMGQIERAMGR